MQHDYVHVSTRISRADLVSHQRPIVTAIVMRDAVSIHGKAWASQDVKLPSPRFVSSAGRRGLVVASRANPDRPSRQFCLPWRDMCLAGAEDEVPMRERTRRGHQMFPRPSMLSSPRRCPRRPRMASPPQRCQTSARFVVSCVLGSGCASLAARRDRAIESALTALKRRCAARTTQDDMQPTLRSKRADGMGAMPTTCRAGLSRSNHKPTAAKPCVPPGP